jgi:hypothetical protein
LARDDHGEHRGGDVCGSERSKQPFVSFAREWADAQDWKATTRESFPHALARLERVLPDRVALGAIDQLAIKRARVDLARTYAPATVDLTVDHASGIRVGRVSRDPTVGAQSRRRRSGDAGKVGPEHVPTRAEVAVIWPAAPSAYCDRSRCDRSACESVRCSA